MAAPDFESWFTLDVARIYAGEEQLADLMPDAPRTDLSWLDVYLRHHGWSPDGLRQFVPELSTVEDVYHIESASKNIDPLPAIGLQIALNHVYWTVWRWHKSLDEEVSNGNAEEARERQTEESG